MDRQPALHDQVPVLGLVHQRACVGNDSLAAQVTRRQRVRRSPQMVDGLGDVGGGLGRIEGASVRRALLPDRAAAPAVL
jgi:hypothetical protein